ncbi:unnamed protein product [Oppiella nova]|uniref:Acylphosphatase n=1 Tax=Oppiella nova TaxID=334625 RepID=A0A7R9QX53_9ACAR|nr:unnamed protein product [Oppiella nova]CAG2178881.1 unnamed protein product [Oppiella nova]
MNFVNKIKDLKLSHVLVWTLIVTIIVVIFASLCLHMSSTRLLSVDFKIFGRVQGVFFRKFTKQAADQLGVFGYCMNHRDGTVIGTIQGDDQSIPQMQEWLQKTGSPYSRIERCEFSNEKIITNLEFNKFVVKH